MNMTRFKIAEKDIVSFFQNSGNSIFSIHEISQILSDNRDFWRLTRRLTANQFIQILCEKGFLKKIDLEFPKFKLTRFTWGDQPLYNLAASINQNAYFSHFTAMHLHNLTNQIPKSIYINVEQPPKVIKASSLNQTNIDRAFSNNPRTTNNFCTLGDYRIYLLSGKNTGKTGVIDIQLPGQSESFPITNLERTLIDITVRPAYSGGIALVLDAFRRAKEIVSINKLVSLLGKLAYIYPYHQAIGFYLERAEYKASQIDLLSKFTTQFNFYLNYKMGETEFSKKWKLYYPKGF